jgi:hypothetical protein
MTDLVLHLGVVHRFLAPVIGDTAGRAASAARPDVEVAGTASDLALLLWRRADAARFEIRGDHALLDRYFVLVPPL